MPFGRINVATLFTMPIGRINIPVSSPSCPMVCRRSPSGENTLMLSANQSLMTMLFCPSKQKKNALLTCIPISPLVSRERNFSPERLNTCMQGLSSQLNTNISLFENLTSTGWVIAWCFSEPWKARFADRIWILLLFLSAT